MYSIGASSRSPSPMTIRPAKSISSIVRRIASVAAASASSFCAAAHEPRGFDRRRLGDADHLEREELFHGRWSLGRRLGWERLSDGNDGGP